MEIQTTRNENEIFREYSYTSHPIERNAGVSNKKKENGSQHGGITRDATLGAKTALLPKGSVRSDEHKAIAPIKSSLTKKDNDIIFLNKEMDTEDAFSSGNTLFSLNISTEAVKDQYAIGKVALDIPDQRISKYREARAYRLLPEPTLETYA